MQYDHQNIEKKWQKFWKEKKTFKTDVEKTKKKFYILDMFPYPSGAGLHVGHVTGYTGTDIIARYKRQCGFNVLHPMGWDSFGLPAEQYAIRTGTHPSITTQKNINTYRKQMESLGFSYDWDREISTSDAKYYKWTQWIFTKLYEKGLAYEAEMFVNFCPSLGTVLANEEVENGKTKEGGYPIIRKPLRQWVLKITSYADRLIEDLDTLDWPESLKKLQINWIGKSEGAQVIFIEEKTKEPIKIFTTRPDTLFGATYLVLSPEHPLISKITTIDKKEKVHLYQRKSAEKSDLERGELAKEKTGVWTGAYAIHPVTEKKIPIWIADYVLMGYGTGAIMSVPAHDERDFSFAKNFNIPIIPVFDPSLKEIEDGDKKQIRKEILSSQRCWEKDGIAINSENEKLSLNGLDVKKAKEKMINWLEKNKKGERKTSYKLRDWLFSRQRYWGEPIPILHFPNGEKRALDIDELPLIPPEINDYKPAGTGESPLAKEKSWIEIIDSKTWKKAKRETNTMPQWAGSCWFYLRFCDPNNDKKAWGDIQEKYWMPVDLYVGGAEHAVLHLLYARFWHKVLYDLKLVSTNEPFQKYRYQGVVTAPSYKKKEGGYLSKDAVIEKQGEYFEKNTNKKVSKQIEKMSKSKLNGVTPDEIIEEFGADALRLYEMFLGPFDREKIWNTDAVSGCKRFLNRFYDMSSSEKIKANESKEGYKLGYTLLLQVKKDLEEMQFNTAIAHMMEFLNDFTKLDFYPKKMVLIAIQLLYPFAPHIASELWEKLEKNKEIAFHPLPPVEEKYLVEETKIYVIQINGKMRGSFSLPKNLTKEKLLKFALSQEKIKRHLKGEIIKTIFVPDKLLNIVIK